MSPRQQFEDLVLGETLGQYLGRVTGAVLDMFVERPLVMLSLSAAIIGGAFLSLALLDRHPRHHAWIWTLITVAAIAVMLAACGAER